MQTTTTSPAPAGDMWFDLDPGAALAKLGSDQERGLTSAEAQARLAKYGQNVIASEPPPSKAMIALGQLKDPMNLMLVAVAVVSVVIGQVSTGLLVAALVVMNVVLGTSQEVKARASVDALAKMQIPQAKVLRDGTLKLIPAPELVPGDIVNLESGDLVPADGRLLASATLETQEAALTGESAPISKDPATLTSPDVDLGDRANMVFQNTSVTRGTAQMVVTNTGMATQMGQIASMLSAVAPSRSPLQRELDDLTKVLGIIAWVAVAIILVMGLVRGQSFESVLLLGVAMAISAIPTGLPTFVQAMLAYGSKQLAAAKAVVKNLTDVETLGATSAINSDKTGTLTMNEMMVSSMFIRQHWYTVSGEGYSKTGEIRHAAGDATPDFTKLAYGLALCSDATVSDSGAVIGDPTEAALVVLAAKLRVDAEESRRAYPRLVEVPFDSAYKFMATFHKVPVPAEIGGKPGQMMVVELVKGGPDVVLDRCASVFTDSGVVPMANLRDEILAANQRMSEKGLRVLAFAFRDVSEHEAEVLADPMDFVTDLEFVGMVGIIDPLRPSAIEAVATAKAAGIEVRMITGDHAVTAGAIGAELGLGPGAISGAQLQAMSDEELVSALPDLHVFGRVTPQDKLRLCKLMQQSGAIVAMTGDAVNDAAALKQADIGVAMGSGSEVTKQAGKMILTDDNFGTLVTAIELGRSIYDKIVSYVRYQMAQLLSLVLLFLAASVFDINEGVAMTPMMVLFLNFFVSIFPVMVIMYDPPSEGIMNRPPRDPKAPIANPRSIGQWLVFGGTLFVVTAIPLVVGQSQLSPTGASVPMTMAFAVMAFGTIWSGLVMRRDPESGFTEPVLNAVKLLSIPVIMTICAVELGFMQRLLTTTSLNTSEWITCLALSLAVPLVVEVSKAIRRRRSPHPVTRIDPVLAVSPARAR